MHNYYVQFLAIVIYIQLPIDKPVELGMSLEYIGNPHDSFAVLLQLSGSVDAHRLKVVTVMKSASIARCTSTHTSKRSWLAS